ncbi:MAG: DUF4783 domain-containing protein [Bacteroidales bacterium]|nr:DUF4783 domain-containing protein [Bacteroidales bacterium]
MKRALSLIVLLVAVAFGSYSFSCYPSAESADINTAIQMGEVSTIVKYMDSNVDLGLSYRNARCTRDEAAGLLSEFFRQNKPCDYVCDIHRNRVSGSLTTADGKSYRVDYTLKTVDNQQLMTGLYVY